MADFTSVWLGLPRPTPLPIHITRNTTVEEMLGLPSKPAPLSRNITPNTAVDDMIGLPFNKIQNIKRSQQCNNIQAMPSLASNPIFSIVCDEWYDTVVINSQRLEKRFDSMEIFFPTEIAALSREYHETTVDLEMKKLIAVMDSDSKVHARITQYFNHRRQTLINKMGKKLDSLEKPRELSNCRQNGKTLSNLAVLQDWFNKYQPHPYPSLGQMKRMAKMANVEIHDVKIWFSCQRIRQCSIDIRRKARLL